MGLLDHDEPHSERISNYDRRATDDVLDCSADGRLRLGLPGGRRFVLRFWWRRSQRIDPPSTNSGRPEPPERKPNVLPRSLARPPCRPTGGNWPFASVIGSPPPPDERVAGAAGDGSVNCPLARFDLHPSGVLRRRDNSRP